MDDDSYNRLMRMFPGNIPEVSDEDIDWPSPSRLRRPRPVVFESPKRVDPNTAAKFRKLMESTVSAAVTSPVTPSVPAKPYLLEATANIDRWLEEAREIERDVTLGQVAEPHRVTRLMLEAIPVVAKFHEGA